MNIDDISLIEKFRHYSPDNKTDEDLRNLIFATGGDEALIDREIIKWWTEYKNATPSISRSRDSGFDDHNTSSGSNGKSATPTPPNRKIDTQPSLLGMMSTKTRVADISLESLISPELPTDTHSNSSFDIRTDTQTNKKNLDLSNSNSVQQKESVESRPTRSRHSKNTQDGVTFEEENNTQRNDQVKDNPQEEHGRERSRSRVREKSAKPRKDRSRTRKSMSRVRGKSARPPGSRFSSQVRLLAEHCFTLSDDAISSLVRYRIPQQSRWDLKEKVQKRDDLIKHLQEALFVLSQEKQRFQSACTDIEGCLQAENRDLRQQLIEVDDEQTDPKEVQELKEQIATLKAKIQAKDDEARKLMQFKNEKEQKIIELSNEIFRLKTDLEFDNKAKVELEHQINILKKEIEINRQQLEKQNDELSTALKNFGEMQKENEEREVALEKDRENAEEVIEDLEIQKRELQDQLSSLAVDSTFLFSELATLKESLHSTNEELKLKQDQVEESRLRSQQLREALTIERELRARAEVKEEEERRDRIVACAQLIAMETAQTDNITQIQNDQIGDITDLKEKVEELTQKKEDYNAENLQLRGKVAEMEGHASSLNTQLIDALDYSDQIREIERLEAEVTKYQSKLQDLDSLRNKNKMNYKKSIEHIDKLIEEKDVKLQHGEIERKKLQSTIQELRGNVRVFVRIRPFLPGEGDETEMDANGNPVYNFSNSSSTIDVKVDGFSISLRKKDFESIDDTETEKLFSFDKAFGPNIGQEAVFKELSEFVQSAIDGYNVCIFSYGETGSGKTHTILGSGNGPMRGIIPRAISYISQCKSALLEQGWEYKVEASFLEVYSETIRDLLAEDKESPFSIKTDKKGRTSIEGLTKIELDLNTQDLIDDLMGTVAKYRNSVVPETHEYASKSNSVFTLYLTGTNIRQGYVVHGQLNLCDLAGSEFAETIENETSFNDSEDMNKSLTILIHVFKAIADRRSHIPIRNSKLTHFLMPTLSGDGKILMISNLSPTQTNYPQSFETLRFSQIVNRCELGKAVKNVRDLDGGEKSKETSTNSNNRSTSEKSPAPLSSSVTASASKQTKATTAKASSSVPPKRK